MTADPRDARIAELKARIAQLENAYNRVVEMIPHDLTMGHLDAARMHLGGPPMSSLTVVAGSYSAKAFREIACKAPVILVEVPDAMLIRRSAWAVVGVSGKVWSKGYDGA